MSQPGVRIQMTVRCQVIAVIRLFTCFFALIFVNLELCSGPTLAQSFRQRGDETIEAAVMESDSILDVIQTSLQGGKIVTVLYGAEGLGHKIAKGAHVELPEIPQFEIATHLTPDSKSPVVQEALPGAYYDTQLTRMLLFRQRSAASGMENFGYTLLSKAKETGETVYLPRPPVGNHLWGWFGFLGKENQQWDDINWVVRGYVEDIEGSTATESWRPFYEIQKEFLPRDRMTTAHSRLFQLPSDIEKWGALLDRVQRAIAVRVQFDQVTEFVPREQQVDFYLSMLREEHVFANYAVRSLIDTGDRPLAIVLLGVMPQLKFFVSDVWEAAVKMVLPKPIEPAADRSVVRLESFISAFEGFSADKCQNSETQSKAVAAALQGTPDILNDVLLGFGGESRIIPLLQRLYQAELRCFLLQHGLQKSAFIPVMVDARTLLENPENSGLTLDEIGLLGKIEKVGPAEFRTKQLALSEFKPNLTEILISTILTTPTGLHALLNYAAAGLGNYRDIAFPDLTRGSFGIWQRCFALFERFEWPQDYCSMPDSRTQLEVEQYSAALSKAIQIAIENEDEELLRNAFMLIIQSPTLQKAELLAQIIPRTFESREKPMRRAFIELLGRMPYYPIARALAEEYSKTGMREVRDIDHVLQQMTGQEAENRGSAKGWIAYLTALEEKRKGHLDKPLFAKSSVLDPLSRPPCAQVEYGWNRMFRRQKLPV